MKKRTYRGRENKLNKIEEYRKHFGWVTQERQERKLVMTLDTKRKYNWALKKLESQASVINRKFPTRMIGWAISGAIFLILYFCINDGMLFGAINLKDLFSFIPDTIGWLPGVIAGIIPLVLLVIGSLNLFFALYETTVWFILKFTRHTTLEEVYRMADAMSGNIIDAPLKGNIEPNTPNTSFLATLNIGSNNYNK